MPDQKFENIDAGRAIDWGKTSNDYDRYRPGPPDSFYRKLETLEIGLPGQRLLDLGTGTGLLARRFAAQQADVAGIDISTDQLNMARAAAHREGVRVEFREAGDARLPFPNQAFDVVTANQCWMYFDLTRTIGEVLRVLSPGGRLLVSHFSFMPHLDRLVRASENLVLKYNPDWTGADWDGVIPPEPRWSRQEFELTGLFVYDEQIPFSRDGWRGRMRALRGISASLSEDEVRAFDEEHERLLVGLAGERFNICHRIHAQIFKPRAS